MYQSNTVGVATRVTGAGLTTITSCNSAVIGVLCCGSATTTGGVQLFHGVTASSSACGIIVFASGSAAQYVPIPVYCSGGITLDVNAAENPDITLFWNPVGGNQ